MTDINRLKTQARRYEQQEQWPRAIELYSEAIEAIEAQGFGTDLSLYNRVGDLYLRQGDTARAVSFYERAIERYAEQGLQTSAVALCNKVLRIAPGRSEIYRTLGRLHAETGLQSQARRSFMEYASRMEAAGDVDAAIEALDEFVILSADEEARVALGRHLISRDRAEEGVAHLHQVLLDRRARGEDEESAELAELIEQAAPGWLEAADSTPPSVEADTGVEDAAPETADEDIAADASSAVETTEDHGARPHETITLLTEAEAAELDQIIADLGGVVEGVDDPDEGLREDPDRLFGEPALSDGFDEEPAETLGASITVSNSTLHELLSEFQTAAPSTIDESDSSVHFDLGVAYREFGLLDEAIQEFTTAIENDQRLIGAHQLLTECLIQKGQYDAGVGAMAEYVRAVEPESDVSGQMERLSELLRASPSEDTLAELTDLLRNIGASPAAPAEASAAELVELSVDELFPDLDPLAQAAESEIEEWNETAGSTGSTHEETFASEVGEDLDAADAVLDSNVDDSASLDALGLPAREARDPAVDAPLAQNEDEDALQELSEALGDPADDWSDAAGLETAWEPTEYSATSESADHAWEAESSWEADGNRPEGELTGDLPAVPHDATEWDEQDPLGPPDAESPADTYMAIEPDAELSDDLDVDASLDAGVGDDADLDASLEAEVGDDEDLDATPDAEVTNETVVREVEPDQPSPERLDAQPAADDESEDLSGLLFGARLANFRARMARSARETDFQAHYDLGLAYKEVALFDEAIAELLVAITGPEALARKSLRLMSEVAHLAKDESLHFTTADHLHQHGMAAEALEHLTRVHDERIGIGDDTSEVRRRMSVIDPRYVPASVQELYEVEEPAGGHDAATVGDAASADDDGAAGDDDAAAGDEGLTASAGDPQVDEPEALQAEPDDPSLVAAGVDPIIEELTGAMPPTDVDPSGSEEPEADTPSEPADEPDGLAGWEERTAELLDDGRRDEAIRELYRIQSAYEAKENYLGAIQAVGSLLRLDPEDVILHHQQVEYAILLGDDAQLATANMELGRCLQRQGALASARTAFEQALAIDPDHEAARDAIAELDIAAEDSDEEPIGAGFAPNFSADDPVHYETHYELGVAFKQDGLHDEAVYELEIAARGLEDPTPAYELLGELFNEAGQHETTIKVLGRVLEENGPEDPELVGVLYQLGVGHQALGDHEQAADFFRRVLAVAADYRDAEDRLGDCSL